MPFDGVWTSEMLGIYNWTGISTLFLENGRYLGGSSDHFEIGRYSTDGDSIVVNLQVTQYGEVRTLFGAKQKHIDIVIEGERNGDVIRGTLQLKDAKNDAIGYQIRLTRRQGLPTPIQ